MFISGNRAKYFLELNSATLANLKEHPDKKLTCEVVGKIFGMSENYKEALFHAQDLDLLVFGGISLNEGFEIIFKNWSEI